MAFISLFLLGFLMKTLCNFVTWILMGNKSSGYYQLCICILVVYSTLMMYGLMLLVERDTEPDGHGLRVTLPYELPRNVLKVRWTSVVLIHSDLGEFNKNFN